MEINGLHLLSILLCSLLSPNIPQINHFDPLTSADGSIVQNSELQFKVTF